MNIFAVDADPVRAARALCDRHIVKMTLETAQILCSAAKIHGKRGPYRATHARHPCVLWAAACQPNFRWLVAHGLALAGEYTRRYGREHASLRVIRWASRQKIGSGRRRRRFAQTMPERYRGVDAVAAYRAYYKNEKARFATWRKPARPPRWW